MGAPKQCRFCRENLADCVCPDDDDVTPPQIPDGASPWLSRMLGPGPSEPGPPYVHTHVFPVEEDTDEGEEAEPEVPPSFTVETLPGVPDPLGESAPNPVSPLRPPGEGAPAVRAERDQRMDRRAGRPAATRGALMQAGEASVDFPAEWTPERVEQFRREWDSLMAGGDWRRRIHLLPPGLAPVRDLTPYVSVVIEWPAPAGNGAVRCMPGVQVSIRDAVTGEPVTTCSHADIVIRADVAEVVTADLTLFADAEGEPIFSGVPVVSEDSSEIRTGVFRVAVSEMRVREVPAADPFADKAAQRGG